MDWLWQNPIADMYGPQFLLLYVCVSAVTVVACRVVVRRLDWTGRMPPPPVPASPDPYEIAYMRGGENEVTRAGIFALIKRGLLSYSRQGKKTLIARTGAEAPRAGLGQIERRVYDWFDRPRESGEVFQGGGLAAKLRGLCAGYEQALRRDHLLTPPEVAGGAWLVRLAGFAVIAGLGFYKLAAALSKGRGNVGLLFVVGVVATIVLLAATRTPRMSQRGRTHLGRLRLAFERLKGGGPTSPAGHYDAASGELPSHGAAGPAVAHVFDPSLVALGVFGATALAAADYENYNAAFQRSSANTNASSSCGGGCGSSDSSSGSDSGSSCGGGGCGGGCGGCGGD